jgi:hypothetical protein
MTIALRVLGKASYYAVTHAREFFILLAFRKALKKPILLMAHGYVMFANLLIHRIFLAKVCSVKFLIHWMLSTLVHFSSIAL